MKVKKKIKKKNETRDKWRDDNLVSFESKKKKWAVRPSFLPSQKFTLRKAVIALGHKWAHARKRASEWGSRAYSPWRARDVGADSQTHHRDVTLPLLRVFVSSVCVIAATTHRLSDARQRSAVGASSRPPPSPPYRCDAAGGRRGIRMFTRWRGVVRRDATRCDATRRGAAPRRATLLHATLSRKALFSAFAFKRIDTLAGTPRHVDDVHVRRMNVGCSLNRSNTRKSPSQLQGRRMRRPCRHRQGTTNVINGPRTYRGLATGGGNGRRGARQRRRHRFPVVNIWLWFAPVGCRRTHSVGGRRRALVDRAPPKTAERGRKWPSADRRFERDYRERCGVKYRYF